MEVADEEVQQTLFEQVLPDLERITDRDRKMVVGYYLEAKSVKEVAAELGMTYKAVEARKKRVLQQLQQWMAC